MAPTWITLKNIIVRYKSNLQHGMFFYDTIHLNFKLQDIKSIYCFVAKYIYTKTIKIFMKINHTDLRTAVTFGEGRWAGRDQ